MSRVIYTSQYHRSSQKDHHSSHGAVGHQRLISDSPPYQPGSLNDIIAVDTLPSSHLTTQLNVAAMPSPPIGSAISAPDRHVQPYPAHSASTVTPATTTASTATVSSVSTPITTSLPQYNLPQELASDQEKLSEALHSLIELKRFLLAAPLQFVDGDIIRQFRLPNDEQISCVRWNNVFCMTGTDIVRCLVHRFTIFGRDVINRKKFEEGVFSDLRNLKINVDAMLENPKSELLEFLYKKNCVRTKKKQKVFFWYSIHHEQLFIDALERELKKEAGIDASQKTSVKKNRDGNTDDFDKQGGQNASSTIATREPALSFKYDSSVSLAEQIPSIMESMPGSLAELVDETISAVTPQCNANDPSENVFSESSSRATSHDNNNGSSSDAGEDYPITPLQASRAIPFDSPSNNLNSWYFESPGKYSPLQSSAPPTLYYTPMSLDVQNSYQHQHQHQHQHPYSKHSQEQEYYSSLPSKRLYQQSQQHPQDQQSYQDHTSWLRSNEDSARSRSSSETASNSTTDDTDFPLEVLVKEDQTLSRPYNETQFDARYTNFAYHNRPAVLYATNGQVLSPSIETANPNMLGPPKEFSPTPPSYLTHDRSSVLSSQEIQPPAWDNILAPEILEFYKEPSKPFPYPTSHRQRSIPSVRSGNVVKPKNSTVSSSNLNQQRNLRFFTDDY